MRSARRYRGFYAWIAGAAPTTRAIHSDGSSSSAGVGSASGPLHASASACGPPASHDRVAEASARLVLAQLQLQPQQALQHPPRQAAVLATMVHRRAQARQRRQHLGADRVHRVLRVSLDQRHRRLHPLDQLPAVLAERQAQQLAATRALDDLAQLRRVGQPRAASAGPASRRGRCPPADRSLGRLSSVAVCGLPAIVTCRPSISSFNIPPRYSRSHGAPENCTAWVISWMLTHSTSSSRSTPRLRAACARFGASSSRRGVHRRVEQRQVVLAEHALGEHARQRAHLRAQQQPRR